MGKIVEGTLNETALKYFKPLIDHWLGMSENMRNLNHDGQLPVLDSNLRLMIKKQ
jgi:hypothetical protein